MGRDWATLLQDTLADQRLSRGEDRALKQLLKDCPRRDRAAARGAAFELIRAQIRHPESRELLKWLEDVVRITESKEVQGSIHGEVLFSPEDDCAGRLVALLDGARRRVDCCVFTITDDRISGAMRRAHERGVAIRVVTDNDKADDRGSDARDLARAGIGVRVDRTTHHMHHKFAVFDRQTLITGSYNWTRSASKANQENLVLLSHQPLISRFEKYFDALWGSFAGSCLED